MEEPELWCGTALPFLIRLTLKLKPFVAKLENEVSRDNNYFSRMLRGDVAPPPIADLLQVRVEAVDLEAGVVRSRFQGAPEFCNPAGQVQGGMLCAMLDHLCATGIEALLEANQSLVTLNLHTTFLRPALPGEIQGEAQVVRQGREISYVEASLLQDGKVVARASSSCKILTRPA